MAGSLLLYGRTTPQPLFPEVPCLQSGGLSHYWKSPCGGDRGEKAQELKEGRQCFLEHFWRAKKKDEGDLFLNFPYNREIPKGGGKTARHLLGCFGFSRGIKQHNL